MSNKKSGYVYLKEKAAKLENKNQTLLQERDFWKQQYDRKLDALTDAEVQRDFLLYHAGFFLRRKFEKEYGKCPC